MQRKRIRTVGVLGMLALAAAACGSSKPSTPAAASHASAKATATTELTSLDASRTVQLTFSVKSNAISTTKDGAVNDPRVLVEGLRVSIEESADQSSATLHSAGRKQSDEIVVSYGSTSLVKIIVVDAAHLYVYVSPTALQSLPLTLTPSEEQTVSEVMAFVGGKWFELPNSLISRAEARAGASGVSGASGQATAQDLATARSLERELESSSTFKTISGPNNTEQIEISGSLSKIEDAVLPTLAKLGSSLGKAIPSSVKATGSGTYLATLSASGSQLTGVRATITSSGVAGTLAMVAHASTEITAPSGATPLPQSLLQQLSQAA